MLLMCQNATMRVCGALIRIYHVLCSKTYNTCDGLVLVPCWFTTGCWGCPHLWNFLILCVLCEKMDMCLFKYECTKSLTAHSQAIPVTRLLCCLRGFSGISNISSHFYKLVTSAKMATEILQNLTVLSIDMTIYSGWNCQPWPSRSQNWMFVHSIIILSRSQQFPTSSSQNQVELGEWATGHFMHCNIPNVSLFVKLTFELSTVHRQQHSV